MGFYTNTPSVAFREYLVHHVKLNLRHPISDSSGSRASVFTIDGVTSEVPK